MEIFIHYLHVILLCDIHKIMKCERRKNMIGSDIILEELLNLLSNSEVKKNKDIDFVTHDIIGIIIFNIAHEKISIDDECINLLSTCPLFFKRENDLEFIPIDIIDKIEKSELPDKIRNQLKKLVEKIQNSELYERFSKDKFFNYLNDVAIPALEKSMERMESGNGKEETKDKKKPIIKPKEKPEVILEKIVLLITDIDEDENIINQLISDFINSLSSGENYIKSDVRMSEYREFLKDKVNSCSELPNLYKYNLHYIINEILGMVGREKDFNPDEFVAIVIKTLGFFNNKFGESQKVLSEKQLIHIQDTLNDDIETRILQKIFEFDISVMNNLRKVIREEDIDEKDLEEVIGDFILEETLSLHKHIEDYYEKIRGKKEYDNLLFSFRSNNPTGYEFNWYSSLPVNKQTMFIADLLEIILVEYMEFIKDSKQKYKFDSCVIYQYTFDEYLQSTRPNVKRSNFYSVFINHIQNSILSNQDNIEQMYDDFDGLIANHKYQIESVLYDYI